MASKFVIIHIRRQNNQYTSYFSFFLDTLYCIKILTRSRARLDSWIGLNILYMQYIDLQYLQMKILTTMRL